MNTFTIAAAIASLGTCLYAQAQSQPVVKGASAQKTESGQELNIRAYIELLRTDIKKAKSQIMSEVMKLDADQAAAFWPVYKEFETELATIGDKVVAVIKSYSDNFTSMTDSKADELAKQVLQIEQQRNGLKSKYYEKVKAAVGAITATRFLQVENQLERLLDLQVASQLPVIGEQ
jgi:hypothetical protein